MFAKAWKLSNLQLSGLHHLKCLKNWKNTMIEDINDTNIFLVSGLLLLAGIIIYIVALTSDGMTHGETHMVEENAREADFKAKGVGECNAINMLHPFWHGFQIRNTRFLTVANFDCKRVKFIITFLSLKSSYK